MKKLFLPENSDDNIKLIGGETTNLLNLANIKYTKFMKFFDVAYSNNWRPEKVANMENDKICYNTVLSPEDKESYDIILSFLIFLDSLQTNNLPSIADKITAPEVVFFLARQTYDEAIHSYSYGYMLKNMLTKEKFDKIIYKWRDHKILRKRNEYLVKLYEDHREKDDNKSKLILMIANYMLEGLYFYNGFMFFHNLASRNLMLASNTQISYIKRDELVHCLAFEEAIKTFRVENPEDWDEDIIYNLFKEAVKLELEFTHDVIGDKIFGMNKKTSEDYTYYLANKRLEDIGLVGIFPKRENPYKHLDKIASIDDESTNKVNSFESTSINYKSPEIYKGWDILDKDDFVYEIGEDEMLVGY